ncbi:MAG: M43 family zinc metalloprotease [Adhaeribacter sp.]
MSKIVYLLFLLLGFNITLVWGQKTPGVTSRTCGTTHLREKLNQQQPNLGLRQERVRKVVDDLLLSGRTRLKQPVIQIPVVFHVIYHTPAENISDAQIQSQLQVLNEDYRHRNADSVKTLAAFKKLATDTGIQFCLATVDPTGKPTTGITRTYTDSLGFASDEAMKFTAKGGQNAWNPSQYLNIWVCNVQNGFLGYAQFPGGDPAIDGVVLWYQTVGKFPANPYKSVFNQGRTATHEIGHWLGLEHIWGIKDTGCDDSDGIADTPPQDNANNGCPTGTIISCNNSAQGGDMYQNFMDYTDDACMNLFTHGQAAYMQAMVSSARPGLLSAVSCAIPLQADFSAADSVVVTGATVQFYDNSIGLRATEWQWTFAGGSPATSSAQNPTVYYSEPGRYAVTLTVKSGAFSNNQTKRAYIFVTANEPRIYPNPAQQFTNIELPANYEVENILLVNNLGQTIRSGIPQNALLRMNLAGLASGIYYAKVILKNGRVVTKKILVLQEQTQ